MHFSDFFKSYSLINIKDKKGFTLIEILIAISVVSLLILTVFFLARNQFLKARDAKRKADIVKIQEAAEEYEKDHDCYPGPQLLTCNPGTGLNPYIKKIPCDPVTNASYYYDYENSSCPKWYRIFTKLENAGDKSIAGTIGPSGSYNFYLGSPNAPIPAVVATPSPTPSASSSSTPSGTASPTPSPSPGSSPGSSFYGCKNLVCVPILWDASRPGPECDPNFQSPDCYGQCGLAVNECMPWK